MSQNPYASESGGPSEFEPAHQVQRTSLTAIFSLLCSIPCCVLPGMGIVGIVLGAMSLAFIGKSNGRLSGRPAAIGGIILGLMSTVIWGAIAAGVLQGWRFYVSQMMPVGGEVIAAMQADDDQALQGLLTSDAWSDLSTERIDRFEQVMTAEWGDYQGVETDFGQMWTVFQNSFQAGGNPQGQYNVQTDGPGIPATLVFQNGKTVMWMVLDPDALDQQQVVLHDFVLQLPSGEWITLREDGPAQKVADGFGFSVIDLP